MATYEFKCKACGKRFTEMMPITRKESFRAKCPKCGSRRVEQLITGFFVNTEKKS